MLVVGAGPGGAACAVELARKGLEVLIIDKAAPPRYKTCGGGLVGRALASLRELEVDVGRSVERSCQRLELHLQDADLVFRVERDPAPVVMAMRAGFDLCVVDAATQAGARLIVPCAFQTLKSESRTEVTVETECGEIQASWIVAADGVGSRVARAAGFPKAPDVVPALESEIRTSAAATRRLGQAARFDFGLVPHGYAWVFPKREHLSIGCLTTRPNGQGLDRPLKQYLERYLATLGLDVVESRQDHGFGIPVRPRCRRLASRRVLLVGDAAGLADPIACEGISNAIESGRLAAQAIAGTHPETRVEERYQELLSTEIWPELSWARRLAPLLYDWPRLRTFMFKRMGQSLCEVLTDVFSGERSLRESAGRPANVLRLVRAMILSR